MDDLFTHRDNINGKVGIGKLPTEVHTILNNIEQEYYRILPDKNASTHHMWYDHMPSSIQQNIKELQQNKFWDKLCDGTSNCIKINADEMDELYYSNPKDKLTNINLYGASGNYNIHTDCVYNFKGIKFYRILIGLTDGNDNVTTYFTDLKLGHKINRGDYIAFDFDNTLHQVIKDCDKSTPRIILKLHYIVCENCAYTPEYVERIKQMYLNYEFVTRYIMQTGTDPETLYEFFWGVTCQSFMDDKTKYIFLYVLFIIAFILIKIYEIKLVKDNSAKLVKYTSISLVGTYFFIIYAYWLRYQLFGIR